MAERGALSVLLRGTVWSCGISAGIVSGAGGVFVMIEKVCLKVVRKRNVFSDDLGFKLLAL